MNSILCVFRLGCWAKGGLAKGGVPNTQSLSRRSLVEHWQRGKKHVHGGSHNEWYSPKCGLEICWSL